MRKLFLVPLLLAACSQGNVTVNGQDGGDGGRDAGPADSGVPSSIPNDGGACTQSCTAPSPLCADGLCVQCLSDTDCLGQSGIHCDTRPGASLFGSCVECVAGAPGECGTGEACDPNNDNCVAGCNADPASCAANNNNEVCDPSSGACVECLTSSDCNAAQSGPQCNPVTHSCVDCLTPADCPATSPGCSQNSCGQCNVSSDCPGTMTCVNGSCACASNADCPASTPVCIPDGGGLQSGIPGQPVCGCTTNQSCGGSNLCDPNQGAAGLCVAPCTPTGCAANADTPEVCGSSGLCVQCNTAADCTTVQGSPYCIANYCGQCQPSGQMDTADCGLPDAGGTPFCATLPGQGTFCAECLTATDCTDPASPGCDSSSYTCGSCTLPQDCPAGMTCDPDGGICG
ncbi:MAG: hypothetical protein ACYDCL_10485 [Myxococcales bacterium]